MKNYQQRKILPFISIVVMTGWIVWGTTAAAQTAATDNRVSLSITMHPIPAGPSVLGVFQGRPPCPLAAQWQLPADPDCEKVKTSLILYMNPASGEPATYEISFVGAGEIIHRYGGVYRGKTISGKWSVSKGAPAHPEAVVYRLETGVTGSPFYLLKGDDNVLFILDKDKVLLRGDADFCYTLNRVELVAAKK